MVLPVSSYDELLALFKRCFVTKDAQTLKADNNGNKSVSNEQYVETKREAVYKNFYNKQIALKHLFFK